MKNILKKSIIRKIIYRKRKIFGCAYLIIHGSKHKNEDKEQKTEHLKIKNLESNGCIQCQITGKAQMITPFSACKDTSKSKYNVTSTTKIAGKKKKDFPNSLYSIQYIS